MAGRTSAMQQYYRWLAIGNPVLDMPRQAAVLHKTAVFTVRPRVGQRSPRRFAIFQGLGD